MATDAGPGSNLGANPGPSLQAESWFPELGGWFAFPVEAVGSPFAFALLFGFGALHALLPGHGKALLAVHGAMAKAADMPPALLVLDGVVLAVCRALVAFALVVGSVRLASAWGLTLPIANLRLLAGIALIAVGLHFLWHAPRRIRGLSGAQLAYAAADGAADARSHIARSLVILAFTPEPVALVLASYGVVHDALPSAALAGLGLALGMGLTLGTAGALAGRNGHRVRNLAPFAGLSIAVILVVTGSIVALGA